MAEMFLELRIHVPQGEKMRLKTKNPLLEIHAPGSAAVYQNARFLLEDLEIAMVGEIGNAGTIDGKAAQPGTMPAVFNQCRAVLVGSDPCKDLIARNDPERCGSLVV